jgi:cephalosporin hydroxylase
VPEHWHELDSWQFLKASSLSARALDWAPDRLEVLFLDSGHEYGHVLAELRAWVPRVTRGGVVLVHDTEWGRGDVNLGAGQPGPVAEALDAYCEENPGLEWRNRPGCFGLGIMRIR